MNAPATKTGNRKNILLLLLNMCAFLAGAQQNNTADLHQKTLTLRRFLEQNHYQPLQWNDSASARLYDRWLEILDDDKLLFSKKEITRLAPYRSKLDEELLGDGWAFFDNTIVEYKTALLRADSTIKTILSASLEFSKADNLNWPQTDYPADNSELFETWKKYLKWRVLRAISDIVTDTARGISNDNRMPADFSQLETKARARVSTQEQLRVRNKLSDVTGDGNDMEDNYLSAITWCYDPHTEYMNAGTKTDFDAEMSGLEFSAGFEMDENEKGDWVISYLVPGGPAWRNGELHIGDVILKIRSGDKPELALADASMEQLSKIFEGGSTEKITITVRTVSGAQKTAVLSKEKITNEEGLVKSYLLPGSKKIGYITLPGFYVKEGDEDNINGCSNDVAKEVVKLKKDSIAGLILDLRYNGGGSLAEALELAGIFINEGSLTSTRDKTGKLHFLKDPNRGTIYDGPMLVMVNTMSASASELVAAVLQDYHRALIVGSPTYGKGSAQVILPMDTTGNLSKSTASESYVKVTNSKFYRVDGSTTQWKGVIPDIELPDMYAMDRFREKGVVSALLPDNSRPAIYQALPSIPLAELKSKSNARVGADNDFKAITAFAEWYKTTNGPREIPLQWAAYIDYYKKVIDRYKSVENGTGRALIKVINNSLDMQRRQLITEQSKAINEVNIRRIEKDDYIAESYKIMQDWLR